MKLSEILDTPEHWCKGHHAEDENGNIVNPASMEACKRCLDGAIVYRAIAFGGSSDVISALTESAKSRGYAGFISMNDHPEFTFEQLQEVLKEVGE